MKSKADVVIIGGGVNGCGLAYNLSKQGVDTVLVESHYLSSGATGRCGAGIRQQWSTKENALLSIQSVKLFEKLSKELDYDIELRQGGYMIAIHDKEGMSEAEANVCLQKSLGLHVDIITPEQMVDIAPLLDPQNIPAIGATFCPTDGHANPFKTTFAYAQAARKNGAEINTHTTVTDIKTKGKKIHAVKTDKGTIKTDTVVNCAGINSKDIADLAGISLPNYGLRKEIIATERLEPLFEAMIISFKDGIYFSQQDHGQIVGGIPVAETQTTCSSMPTTQFVKHMAQTLIRYAPRLKEVNMLRHWTGFYDVTPDARPILGIVDQLPGFIQCNGFSGHGFMLSPITTKMLTDLIAFDKTNDVLESLNLRRFESGDFDSETYVCG